MNNIVEDKRLEPYPIPGTRRWTIIRRKPGDDAFELVGARYYPSEREAWRAISRHFDSK